MLVESFRRFLNKKTLAKQPKPIRRQPIAFDAAKWVGIIYDATSPERRSSILELTTQLESTGKKVSLLGFINEKRQNIDVNFEHFCKNDLNWKKIPSNRAVEAFMTKSYDVLFTLDTKSSLPFEYISTMTDAGLKVGPATNDLDAYDLMIQSNKQTQIQSFINAALQYCNLLEPAKMIAKRKRRRSKKKLAEA